MSFAIEDTTSTSSLTFVSTTRFSRASSLSWTEACTVSATDLLMSRESSVSVSRCFWANCAMSRVMFCSSGLRMVGAGVVSPPSIRSCRYFSSALTSPCPGEEVEICASASLRDEKNIVHPPLKHERITCIYNSLITITKMRPFPFILCMNRKNRLFSGIVP